MKLRILTLVVTFLLPLSTFAFQDDYVWQEKFKKTVPKAEAGDINAQYELASMYEKGNGVARDYEAAFKWYLTCAEKNNDKCAYKVGYDYLHGIVVGQDYQKAYKWLNVAADHNNVRAFYFLGTMYEKGNGVSKDLDKAQRWYTRASKGGYRLADERLSEVKADIKQEERELQAAMERQRRQKKRTARAEPKVMPDVKKVLLAGEWSKRNRPAEYLPSKITQCKDKGKTLECVSQETKRNIGMADIKYTTKAIVYSIKTTGEFKVSYRNNVVDINITDKEFVESGGKVPVKLGWQDAEHKLECNVDSNNQVSCTKNKIRSVTFNSK